MSTARITIEDVLEATRGKNPHADFSLIQRAYVFAERAHREQKRESGEPYIVHPLSAARTLAEMRMDDASIAAALLHDVVDDTPTTIAEIKGAFGEEISFLVNGVTKLGKIKYRGVERHVENLRKMFLAMAEDVRVVLIKLADRLHNMETIASLLPEKQRRIALETLDIYSPLAGRLGIGDIKVRLEDLAFPVVYPEEHKWLLRNVRELYEERRVYCERLIPVVQEQLSREGTGALAVQARAKHYYSLWKKLQRYDMDFTKIYDLVALRVLVPDVTACYATLGALHQRWKPLPGRIKDYVAIPKPNGYQSIHTTVFCEDGKITEFQIRTQDMHAQAEYGIAAHWAYSEGDKESLRRPERFRWVEQLRDWQREVRGTDEFLDALRIDFFQDRIFVFTPKGDVIELPEGATPIDFAYAIHSEIGNQAVGARVSDRFVGLDAPLANGDVVEITIQKGKKPSSKWLELARTSMAKHQIRKALREQGIEVAAPLPASMRAELHLNVGDRVSLMKDVTTVVSQAGLNIKKIEGSGEGATATIALLVTIENRAELKRLLERLKKVKGIFRAEGRVV